jgi:hypothetical protein
VQKRIQKELAWWFKVKIIQKLWWMCSVKRKINYECMGKSLATSKDRKDDQLLLQRLEIIKIIVPRICVHDMWTIELAVISFLILTLLILTLNYSQYLLFIISKNLMTSSLQIRSLSNSMTSEPTTEFLSNQIVFFSLISRFFI